MRRVWWLWPGGSSPTGDGRLKVELLDFCFCFSSAAVLEQRVLIPMPDVTQIHRCDGAGVGDQ